MEVYRTEEEQIDFIKRWWKNNGSSVVTGIAVAVAIAVGWQTWHQREQAKSESDSLLFSQVQDAARAAMAAPAEEGKESPQRATFKHLLKQMKDEHAGTSYSVLTAMLAARDAVEQGDAVGRDGTPVGAVAKSFRRPAAPDHPATGTCSGHEG